MSTPRKDRLRRMRAVVALLRGRLFATGAGRAARFFAGLSGVGLAVAAVVLRVSDGAEAHLSGLTVGAARWLPWVAGAPLALAAAADRASLDRRDGIEGLAASRGIGAAALASARALAAMSAIGWVLGAPLVSVALLAAAFADRLPLALHRLALAAAVFLFAVLAGASLGAVASACARLGRARGRWLLVAVVLGPWALADLAGHGAWSLPGALDAALTFLLGAARA